MPDDDNWAFEEEIDLWDEDERPVQPSQSEPDGFAGQDPDSVVTVIVSLMGAVQQVKLTTNWKTQVDPRALNTSVLAAANAATVEALAQQAREVHEQPPRARADTDETPLTPQDVLRLDEAVKAELDQFSVTMSAPGTVSADSSGGHVSGTAQGGRFLSLEIDPTWASIARNAEIESELLDILRALHRNSAPSGFAQPQGPAYTELMGLLFDPARLLRRVGLTPPPGLTAHLEGRDRR